MRMEILEIVCSAAGHKKYNTQEKSLFPISGNRPKIHITHRYQKIT
jgi:hypothetical protein